MRFALITAAFAFTAFAFTVLGVGVIVVASAVVCASYHVTTRQLVHSKQTLVFFGVSNTRYTETRDNRCANSNIKFRHVLLQFFMVLSGKAGL